MLPGWLHHHLILFDRIHLSSGCALDMGIRRVGQCSRLHRLRGFRHRAHGGRVQWTLRRNLPRTPHRQVRPSHWQRGIQTAQRRSGCIGHLHLVVRLVRVQRWISTGCNRWQHNCYPRRVHEHNYRCCLWWTHRVYLHYDCRPRRMRIFTEQWSIGRPCEHHCWLRCIQPILVYGHWNCRRFNFRRFNPPGQNVGHRRSTRCIFSTRSMRVLGLYRIRPHPLVRAQCRKQSINWMLPWPIHYPCMGYSLLLHHVFRHIEDGVTACQCWTRRKRNGWGIARRFRLLYQRK